MKKILYIFSLMLSTVLLTGCFEDYNERYLFTDFRVEFEDAVIRNPAAGLDYAVVGTLRNNAGLRQYRINLIGGLSDRDQVFPVRLVDQSTAVEGTHFSFVNGAEIRIPAGEAFGTLDINIPTLTNTAAVRAVFELLPNNEVKVSARHSKIGINIQR